MNNITVKREEHNPGSKSTPIAQELAKEYCYKLAKTVLRYSSPEEISAFTGVIERFAQRQTNTRYNPGLNDAKYSLYRRYWLKGGAV